MEYVKTATKLRYTCALRGCSSVGESTWLRTKGSWVQFLPAAPNGKPCKILILQGFFRCVERFHATRSIAQGNGWIDESDAIFDQLRTWSPTDQGAGQLLSLQGNGGVGTMQQIDLVA